MKKTILPLILVATLAACSTQTAYINGQTGKLGKEDMQTFFVSGLGQTQTVDAAAVCDGANNVIKVERQTSFLNGILGLLTSGIYTPYDAKVYCQS
jgi:Bor protein/Prokaryotic membrane lipoprotein lipid attachment site